MERAELAVQVTEGTEVEVARVVATLPDGRYCVLFLSVCEADGSVNWKAETVGTGTRANDVYWMHAPKRVKK